MKTFKDLRTVQEQASPMIKPPKNEFGKKEDAFAHAKKHGGKVMKKTFTHPTSGMQTVSYVVREDAEQIDELKRTTLANYVSKAAGSYGRDKQNIGRESPDGTVAKARPELKRAVKNRLTGINRAAERLAKEETEIDEAIKLNSKVKIHAPGKDYHGKVGHVGEIRKGLHDKAPKTYTVDYDYDTKTGNKKSIQLDKSKLKMHNEETEIDEAIKKPNATTRFLRQYPVSDKEMAKPVKQSEYQHHVVSKLDGNVLASYKSREAAHRNAYGNPVVSGSLETIGDRKYVREQGVAEGTGKNVVKSVKVGNFRHDLVDTGMGWQVRIYNGDELYDTGMSKNSEQKGLAALEDAVAYTEKQTRTKRQGVSEGEGKTQKYEMMMRNGQVKKFVAKDDADAKRIAAGHGAKSVIRLRGGVPAGKVAEGSDKLPGTPVVSLSDFDDKDSKKDKYGRTVPKKLKKDDPRVKFHKDQRQGVAEAGPFSYGAKPPRKGSVAYNALMQRKEQDKKRVKEIEAIGTKHHHVGVAKVTKEDIEDVTEAKDTEMYKYIDQSGGQVIKGKSGTYVGYTHSATKGKGANILKHHNTKKYYAAGGSSTAFTAKTTLHDTPQAAAKAYHKGNLAEQDEKEAQEYDYEGDMARSDLRSIIFNAQEVHDMLEPNTNLPEWVQAKITKAEDYMSSVRSYMKAENEDL